MGDVRPFRHRPPSPVDTRLVGARRFAECLAEVICQNEGPVTLEDRAEALDFHRNLIRAIAAAETDTVGRGN